MTTIELNIAGLHVTGSTPDVTREALKQSWQRNCRALRQSVKNANWRPAQLRPRHAAERPAA
jgi:hypothetical protein